jgi:ubiquinone/menaquinone biosynthesis C-methylase UbiE
MSPPPGADRGLFDVWSYFYDLPVVQWTTYWPVHDAVVRALGEDECQRILDLGCGTGQLSARIARDMPRVCVVGCDFSGGMLRRAAARHADVLLARGDASRLPFRAASFDAVVSTEAFHWFPDPARALDELFRIVVPGGRILVAVASAPTAGIAAAIHRASRLVGEPFYWPTVAGMRERVEAAGFRVLRQERIFRLPGGILFPPMLTIAKRPR